jgi:hypothetical protein
MLTEHYACLFDEDQVVGIADFSAKTGRRVCFMNYFGVREGWRDAGAAQFFFQEVQAGLRERIPFVEAILFELEPIDWSYLGGLSGSIPDTGEERSRLQLALRSLARMLVFNANHALAALQPDGSTMPYWEPIVDGGDRRLTLMLLPTNKNVISVKDAVDFVYDEVYGEAYQDDFNFPAFRSKALSLKGHFDQYSDCTFRTYPIPRELARLLLWAEDKGISVDL